MENMINRELLKKLRSKKNWSQEELATVSGLSHRTVQRIENSGNCSLESKRALSVALDIDASKLEFKKSRRFLNMQSFKLLKYLKTMASILFLPLILVIAMLAARNYQGDIEFNIVINDQNGAYSDTLTVDLNQGLTHVFDLHNGYSLEIDYIYGMTPRLKSQLYISGENGKVLLHSSNRTGTEFQPVKYVVNSMGNVSFISPFINLDAGVSSI